MILGVALMGLGICIIWLIVITILFTKLLSHYNSLVGETDKKSLINTLDQVLREQAIAKKDVATLINRCDTIEKDGSFHIQKIGLLRFNPFKDTGGDQSFIISLLDANDTGVVISGLYSRSGTRWYAKKVENGRGIEHELSDEEKRALRLAKKAA